MDGNPGVRASDRRVARPHHPPRQHPRDERRQLSSRPKPRPKGRLKPSQKNRHAGMKPPLGLRPPGGLIPAPQVADFYAAHWPDFAPPLTLLLPSEDFNSAAIVARTSPAIDRKSTRLNSSH